MAKTKEDAPTLPSAAEARQVLERGLRALRAFQDADKVIALLENAEQVTRERHAAADAAKAEAEAAQAQVVAAKSELQDAKAKAKQIVDAAASRAEQHENNAKTYAAKVTAETDEKAAKVQAELDSLIAQCLEKQQELTDLAKQADVAREVIAKAEKIRSAMQ